MDSTGSGNDCGGKYQWFLLIILTILTKKLTILTTIWITFDHFDHFDHIHQTNSAPSLQMGWEQSSMMWWGALLHSNPLSFWRGLRRVAQIPLSITPLITIPSRIAHVLIIWGEFCCHGFPIQRNLNPWHCLYRNIITYYTHDIVIKLYPSWIFIWSLVRCNDTRQLFNISIQFGPSCTVLHCPWPKLRHIGFGPRLACATTTTTHQYFTTEVISQFEWVSAATTWRR